MRTELKGPSLTTKITLTVFVLLTCLLAASLFGYHDRDYLVIELVLGVLAAMILVRFVMGRLTRPLVDFIRHVRDLPGLTGQERFFTSAATDEIGVLADTFNAMLRELDRKQQELEKSEQLYRAIVEFSSELVIWRNVDRTIRYVSPNCALLTGYREENFYSDPSLLDSLAHPDDFVLWKNHAAQENPHNLPIHIDYRIITRGGDVRWFSHTCHPVVGKTGERIGLRGSYRDITEQKRMEEAIISGKAFAENLIDNAAVPIFVIDQHHRVLFWNKACEEMTGVKAEVLIGSSAQWSPFYSYQRPTLADMVVDGNISALAEHYTCYAKSHLLSTGMQAEGWYDNLGGKRRYIYFDAAPVTNHRGDIVAAIETLQDITPRKALEESLRLSEEKFSKAFQSSPDWALIKRLSDGVIQDVNEAFLKTTGYGRDEVVGRSMEELGIWTYPAQRQSVLDALQEHGEVRNLEVTIYTKTRTTRIMLWSADIISLEGEQCMLANARDLTEQKMAERKLRQSQAELITKHEQLNHLFRQMEVSKKEWEGTFDCIGDPVLMANGDARIKRCNRAVLELFSVSYKRVIGMSWQDLVFNADMDVSLCTEKGGELFHRPTGRWFFLSTYPFTELGDQQVSGEVVTLHDTTEIRKVSSALEKTYAELKDTQSQMLQNEKMASIGQLAAGVAHEINNPIGFITSNLGTLGKYTDRLVEFISSQAEAMESEVTPEVVEGLRARRKQLKLDYIMGDSRQLIAESLDGADRVKKIVQDLKSFSRIDEADCKCIDIRECLESTINIVWNELKYKVTLNREYGEIPPVKCYPQQLNQVFMNLLVNAAHAIETQGEITLRTEHSDGFVSISVSDTGSGIPKEILTRIFEPFFTTKEVGKGTGLGLSISYDIIKKHKGELLVRSELGVGTTFTVRIPVE